ncbi:MAG: recombinase RecA [Candidatus Methanoperedenaceae archaeon]|nr:recombinase RecA [Candidatus Methanoperedenaceae archaeon]
MSPKKVIMYNIMYQSAAIEKNAVITVTTNESGTQILDWFKESNLSLPFSSIGIIDCITRSAGGDAVENENIKMASSPLDLTGIGVRISQFLEEFQMKKNIQKIQLHINSLSTILMYSNIHTVFRFIHVFTGRIKASGGLGIFVMESGMHDEQAIATLKQLFDGVIEIKTENDMDYIRIIGLSTKPTPWFEYEIEGANLRIVNE